MARGRKSVENLAFLRAVAYAGGQAQVHTRGQGGHAPV